MVLAIFGLVTLLFVVLMVKVPYFRVANWPNTGIGLFLMGITLIAGPAANWLLKGSGVVRAVGATLALVIATTAVAGLVAFWLVPRSLRHRFGEWDAIAANPWATKPQRESPDKEH